MSHSFDPTTKEGQDAVARWVKQQFDNMGGYVVKKRLLPGDQAEGRAAWAIPGRIFLGKIWAKDDRKAAYWVISGTIPTDHVEEQVAKTARAAARHFCLKWQLESARIASSQSSEPAGEDPSGDWTGVSESLAAQAEALYKLVDDDSLWVNVRDEE